MNTQRLHDLTGRLCRAENRIQELERVNQQLTNVNATVVDQLEQHWKVINDLQLKVHNLTQITSISPLPDHCDSPRFDTNANFDAYTTLNNIPTVTSTTIVPSVPVSTLDRTTFRYTHDYNGNRIG
jgi:uncharacterized coiled-coil protein SlyX